MKKKIFNKKMKTNHQAFTESNNKNKSVNKKPKVSQKSIPNEVECSMSGSLALAFRMSQIVGIAPVKFERQRDGSRVSVSRAMIVWCLFYVTMWNLSAFIGLVRDLMVPREYSVRATSTTQRFVWVIDFTIVMTIACLAGYRAPKRSRALIRCLNQIQKINHNLNIGRPKKSEERKKCAVLLFFVVFSISIFMLDFNFVTRLSLAKHKIVDAMYLYAGYYYAYIILLILVTQFIICVLEICRTMKCLNDILEGVSQIHKYYQPYNQVFVVPNKSVNQAIDSLGAVSDNVYLDAKSAPKTLPETIRLLALMYGSACDAVEQLNCCFAPELLALLASFLLHLVVTPYNFIDNIIGGAINYGLLVMQTLWCIIHFSCTVGLAEPCHITQIEIKRTNRLVSYLMLQSTDELVKPELDNFGKFLYLNNTEYSPMGICVLTRSLVASIIGSVATYLVIIIQFQESDII